MPMTFSWYLSDLRTKNLYVFLMSPTPATCPVRFLVLNLITLMTFHGVNIFAITSGPLLLPP
jgi:hypothetical protein